MDPGLEPDGLAASAQDLTQSSRSASTRRACSRKPCKTASSRMAARSARAPPDAACGASRRFSLGNANVWARGADQFGSASERAPRPGYDINRAAPFIAGIDWRLDNDIVAGVAATYVATIASFKDGSRTNVDSYQGAAYVGWAGGPWYALGSAVVSFNDFSTSRFLTPFGLPGDATSSPSGQSYQGHAEAGYHWGHAGRRHEHQRHALRSLGLRERAYSGFSETGGFGALSVNAADSNSFQTTLGVRLTSRIQMGTSARSFPNFASAGTTNSSTPRKRSGPRSSACPEAPSRRPASPSAATRALIGAGFSMELSPDAKVFVDYDGKLSQRFQEHSDLGRVAGEVLAAPQILLPLFAREKQLSVLHEPGGASFEDGVCIDDELAGAGDDGNAVVFSAFGKALIEGDESLVPSLRGCLSGGEQGLSDP